MANDNRIRLKPEQRAAIKQKIIERDGELCLDCQKRKGQEIHHSNGDPNDWNEDGLWWLCKQCHGKHGPRRGASRRGVRARVALGISHDGNHNKGSFPERGREGEKARVSMSVEVEESVSAKIQVGSRELQIKRDCLPLWLQFMFREINACGYITVKKALHSGTAESGGVSSNTIRRWLNEWSDEVELCPFELAEQAGLPIVLLKKGISYEEWLKGFGKRGIKISW